MTTTVGCIGGGQLGRMLALAGIPLGLRFRFLDPSPDACAGDVGELVVGEYSDPDALRRLADGAGAVTFEFENVPAATAESAGTVPGPAALLDGQDRLLEKQLFQRLGITTTRFGTLAETGLPAIVKTRRLGYDGKGQRRIDAPEHLAEDELAERVVPFDRELSVIAVRGRDGDTRFWPVTENVHRDGILFVSRSPVPAAPQAAAEGIALRLLDALEYVGVLAVELFQIGRDLLANEFAPRVHNSGHWTIDGAVTSQFENHVRAVVGLPLGDTASRGASVMVNLVGELPPLEQLTRLPGAHVHLYGKTARPGRKLGHVTLVDAAPEAVDRAVALAGSTWC